MQARWFSVIALALLIAGCSGGATPTPTVGPGYLAAATAFDGAYLQWKAAITGKTTPGEFAGPAATYAAALSAFDDAISSLGATGQTATDITSLVSADKVVIADLGTVSAQTAGTFARWGEQLTADGAKAILAGRVVRTDLALPQASGQ